MARRLCWLTLWLAILAAGCSRSPRLAPVTGSTVVLAFGDSLTWGTGAAREDAYPAQLARLLGCRVVNRGVPGEESGKGLARLPTVLEEVAPDLLVLIHGGNDFLRHRPGAATKHNLDRMLALARDRGVEVVLVAVPAFGLLPRPPGLYRELADAHGVVLVEDLLPAILADRSLKSDRVHPNARGYRRLAERLAEVIRAQSR